MDIIILSVVTVLLFVWILIRSKKPSYLHPVTEEEFKKNYRKAQLIDVREEKEFDGGHILGARNVPLSQMKQRITEIRPDQPVYMYCNSGSRTKQAAKIMRKKRGVEEMYTLKGGFKKWTGKVKK